MNWGALVIGQLEFYWDAHLHPRLKGLTDEEYLWEPVDRCWSLRPTEQGVVMDGPWSEPPSPVTTIAWRMMHIATGCFIIRTSTFFRPSETDMFDPAKVPTDLPLTAAEGVAFLEKAYDDWLTGIKGLTAEEIEQPLGPGGANFRDDPMAALIVHINREVMHHGGEIGVLRDLWRERQSL